MMYRPKAFGAFLPLLELLAPPADGGVCGASEADAAAGAVVVMTAFEYVGTGIREYGDAGMNPRALVGRAQPGETRGSVEMRAGCVDTRKTIGGARKLVRDAPDR